MNNWRPEGWEDIKDKYLALHSEKWAWDDESFEMGADTMLEALKEHNKVWYLLGRLNADDPPVLGIGFKNEPGWVIFIPDKED